jgi:hypothetical protein
VYAHSNVHIIHVHMHRYRQHQKCKNYWVRIFFSLCLLSLMCGAFWMPYNHNFFFFQLWEKEFLDLPFFMTLIFLCLLDLKFNLFPNIPSPFFIEYRSKYKRNPPLATMNPKIIPICSNVIKKGRS